MLYEYGVNFTASMIIVFKLTIFNYYILCVSQPPDTFKKVANCANYKIKLKQSNFERNAKKILGIEHFSLQIRDIENKSNKKKSTNILPCLCDVTLSVYPHRVDMKNMPGHGGIRTYDLWNTSPMLFQLSYAVKYFTISNE